MLSAQIYTPGSDLAAGLQANQFIWGRDGNNTLIGYQSPTANPGQINVDILLGDTAIIPSPSPHNYSNTFVLGDWRSAYYANGNPQIFGLNDSALILDFNPTKDTIQLKGNPNNYQLVNLGVGEAIVLNNATGPDVIGVLLGNSNLSLEGQYFQYQGNTPPPGPVQPQIQQLGSPGFDLTPTTATDTSGNVYIAGGTTGSLGSPSSGQHRDALAAKYDSNGNLLGTRQFGSPGGASTIAGIGTDGQDNSYLVGSTEGPLATPLQATAADAFITKYDSNGNQLWIQQFGKDYLFQGNSIAVDNSGNAYASGVDVSPFPQTIPGLLNLNDAAWVAKYDTNGNRQWFTEIGDPTAFNESYGNAVGKNNDVFATGWTLGNLGGQNAGLYDAWIGKFDSNTGQSLWTRQLGTPDYDWSWSVATDSQDNVYGTGWTLGTFAGQQRTGNSYDAWVTKYDSQGNQQWIRQFGDSADTEAFHTYVDSQDNILLTGYTNGNLGGANAGSFDAWVAEYDTNGNQKWIKQFGTPGLDEGYGITADNKGNVYVTGVTAGSLGALNSGSVDSWTAKLSAATGNLENFSGTPGPVNCSSTSTPIA